MPAAETIRELAVPVVMISANGLLCLALYNRLAAITARLRLFIRERFEIDMRLVAEDSAEGARSEVQTLLRQRLETLEDQCRTVLNRAWYIRGALVLLLASVVGMLLVTLELGLLHAIPAIEAFVLVTFVISVLLVIAGIMLAIGELLLYLEPVKAEGLEMKLSAAFAKARRRKRRSRSKRASTVRAVNTPRL